MQTTSAVWDALWASGTATLDAVAVINGVEYTDISAPLITRGTMQGQLSIGNVVSACCALSVRAASSVIPRSATVQIKHRLVSADGATVSEWLPAGTFYISRRRVDPINGVVILECYDALMKTNEEMPTLPGVTYPISMTVAAQTIAQIIGVEIDARTAIQTGAEYIIGAPTAGTTMRDILATIAGANAGNWIMTPAGKLRLVPVVDVTGAASPLAVSGVIGGIQIGDAGTVTGVRREDEDGNQILIGTDGGIIVDVGLSAPLALAASEILIGQVYQPYAMTGAVYSPAAEIGDPVDTDGTGTVIGVLYNETASLGPAYRGDISAPGATEYSNEYPFIGGNAKTLTIARAYAREVTQALDDSLDQEEVFNRLTDNGLIQGLYMLNGQLYVNANYIRSGTLVLGGLNDVNGLLQIMDANGNLVAQGDSRGLVINNGRIAMQIPSVHTGGNDLHINDEWNTAGVKYAIRNVANLGNDQYSTVLIDRGVLSVIDGNNESIRLKTTNLTPGNINVNAVGAMDTVLLALDGYGQTSTDPDVIEWSRMGMNLSNEKVRFYLGNGSSDAQTWFALSLGQLSYKGDVMLTKPLPVSSGGTGASTAAAALSALGGVAVTDNAGFHNSIYRGKNLGTSVTAAQWAAIDAGTFEDLFIGDYWTINGVTWRIAAFDYWYNCGDTACTTHHVVIVPDSAITTCKMNNTNITIGAYVSSVFYTGSSSNTGKATTQTAINNAFGSAHILNHREYLKNQASFSDGYESGGAWYDSTFELMTEQMVYGCKVFGNVINGTSVPASETIDTSQLPLFRHDHSRICNRANWWLRDVVSAASFACVGGYGDCIYHNPSYSFGVRPAFGIRA